MKYYIGIDLGGTNVRTLLVDENGKTYRTNQEFKLTTVVLQRNAKIMDNIEP